MWFVKISTGFYQLFLDTTHFVLKYFGKIKKKIIRDLFFPQRTHQNQTPSFSWKNKKLLWCEGHCYLRYTYLFPCSSWLLTCLFQLAFSGTFVLKLHLPLANWQVILGSLLASGEVFRVHADDYKWAQNDTAPLTTTGNTTCHRCHCWAHLTFKKLSTQKFSSG